MKKLNKILVAFAIALAIISCNKEEIAAENRTQVEGMAIDESSMIKLTDFSAIKVENGLLVFPTVESYYAIVNDEDAQIRIDFAKYVSNVHLKNYFTEMNFARDKESSQEMDEFLGQILNKDGCIQIGAHIYRVDLLNEQVLVLDARLWTSFSEILINGQTHESINKYSISDDVISIVNDPLYNGERCSNVADFNIPGTGAASTSNEFITSLKLFKGGIYYRITGRTKRIGSSLTGYRYKLSVVSGTAEIRRKPCSNSEVTTHYAGLKMNTYEVTEPVWEAYSKSWNVKQIYMYIQTKAEFGTPEDDGLLLINGPIVGVNL